MDFKRLQLIFYALAGGQILFAAVVYFMINQEQEFADASYFSILVPVVVIGSALLAYVLNGRFLSDAQEQKTEAAQFEHYRRRVIVRLAILEGGNLVALVAALTTGKFTFFLFFALGIAFFFYFRPTLFEMSNDYPNR
jgi:hypothetical protein